MQVPNPEFEGQTKAKLGNPEVRRIVDNIVTTVSSCKSLLLVLLKSRCARYKFLATSLRVVYSP